MAPASVTCPTRATPATASVSTIRRVLRPAIRAVASYRVATEARTLALYVLEVRQRLVLFDRRGTGRDVGHLPLKLLHQRLHGRVVRT
jgi:hypothetical protein